ncbi:hypothetical protein T11_9933 [Trichinella zimbabwensis]|uniref:Uncharacterized protein n=1 Tax=Trichinella zimbabwensis TaxID=268475 RepID=A0A0V1GTP6_9BILA|nr:hypothetical protein T11_9933 [Trichinella zimbabwensis]
MSSRQPVSDETLASSERENTDISNVASETDDSVKFQAENELGDSFKMELIKHGYLINATLSEAIAAPSSKSQD